jgi:hypothetical protein
LTVRNRKGEKVIRIIIFRYLSPFDYNIVRVKIKIFSAVRARTFLKPNFAHVGNMMMITEFVYKLRRITKNYHVTS